MAELAECSRGSKDVERTIFACEFCSFFSAWEERTVIVAIVFIQTTCMRLQLHEIMFTIGLRRSAGAK